LFRLRKCHLEPFIYLLVCFIFSNSCGVHIYFFIASKILFESFARRLYTFTTIFILSSFWTSVTSPESFQMNEVISTQSSAYYIGACGFPALLALEERRSVTVFQVTPRVDCNTIYYADVVLPLPFCNCAEYSMYTALSGTNWSFPFFAATAPTQRLKC
jgi:hypothetical protein